MSEKDILEKIKELNKNDEILVFSSTLPRQISKEKIINAINPSKDVDGFNPINVGNLHQVMTQFSYTLRMSFIDQKIESNLAGKHAVIIEDLI